MSAEQAATGTHATDWCTERCAEPCGDICDCWDDGEAEAWDDCELYECDCGTCTAVRLDRQARLVERPMVTVHARGEYL